MNDSRRLLPTVLLVALVVVASASSGAIAAKLITSADIKNGTIKVVDLNKKTVKKLKGQDGAPGTALAYAHIKIDGTVDTSRTKGIVVKVAYPDGTICLDYVNGTAKVVVATIDLSGADVRKDQITVTTDKTTVDTACGGLSGADILAITADNSASVRVPKPFYLAVIS